MTRFARAKGSKASNERIFEEATSWQEMKSQLIQSKNQLEEEKNRKIAESKRNENYKNFLKERDDELLKQTKWAEFPDVKLEKQNKLSEKSKNISKCTDIKNKRKLKGKLLKTEHRHIEVIATETENEVDQGKGDFEDTESSPQSVIKSKKQKLKKVKRKLKKLDSEVNEPTKGLIENNCGTNVSKNETKKYIKPQSHNIELKDEETICSSESASEKQVHENTVSRWKKLDLAVNKSSENSIEKSRSNNSSKKIKVLNKRNKNKEYKKQYSQNIELRDTGAEKEVELKATGTESIKNNKKEKHQNVDISLKKLDSVVCETSFEENISNSSTKKSKFGNKKNKNKEPKKPHPKKERMSNGEFKRRKSPIDKMIINGKEVEISYFDGFPIKREDAENLAKLKREMVNKGLPRSEIATTLKLERRKAEKALTREKKKVCFNCRIFGHNLSECPTLSSKDSKELIDTAGTGVCFKCGSTEHTAFACRVVSGQNFKYATCFICKEQGHISRQCPDNGRGLYPKGGCCRVCGDVTHLKKDCPQFQMQQEREQQKFQVNTFNGGNPDDLEMNDNTKNYIEPKITPNKIIKF